jgi:protein-disulfide isomerase
MVKDIRDDNSPTYWISTIALLVACGLTLISWFQLCSQACAEGHSYRLFGLTFEHLGLTLFPIATILHLLSKKFSSLSLLIGWMLCAMLGAEVMFIYVQKYKIGSWCPVCLSIAAALAVAGIAYLYEYYQDFKRSLENSDRGHIMMNLYKGLTGIGFFFIGFLIAFSGIGKYSPLQAAENDIKENISFGNPSSDIEVYVFTDWSCPACRSIEPILESSAPKIMQKAKLVFVDDPVHPETLNFTPYNVSFMINNKDKYLQLRQALTALSEDTKEPADEQINALAKKFGVQYKQLRYSDVALANKYYTHLIKQLEVEGTPTVVIVNAKTQKGKKLPGATKITEENILKAIDSLSKPAKAKK